MSGMGRCTWMPVLWMSGRSTRPTGLGVPLPMPSIIQVYHTIFFTPNNCPAGQVALV